MLEKSCWLFLPKRWVGMPIPEIKAKRNPLAAPLCGAKEDAKLRDEAQLAGISR